MKRKLLLMRQAREVQKCKKYLWIQKIVASNLSIAFYLLNQISQLAASWIQNRKKLQRLIERSKSDYERAKRMKFLSMIEISLMVIENCNKNHTSQENQILHSFIKSE